MVVVLNIQNVQDDGGDEGKREVFEVEIQVGGHMKLIYRPQRLQSEVYKGRACDDGLEQPRCAKRGAAFQGVFFVCLRYIDLSLVSVGTLDAAFDCTFPHDYAVDYVPPGNSLT